MTWTWETVSAQAVQDPAYVVSVLNRRMKLLEGELSSIRTTQSGVVTFVDGDTTPSVGGGAVFVTANTGNTSVTQFDNGTPGQRVVVVFGDAKTTLVNGTNLKVNGGANFTGAAGNVKQFVTSDGTVFREVSQPTVWD